MASRAEQKQQARARRLAAEQAERRAARRRSSLMRLGLVLSLAVIVVVVAVVVSSGGNDNAGGTGSGDGSVSGDAAAATALFRGIPQNGIHLGDANGKPTLIEFADLQCPFCAEYSNGVLPTAIKNYVRPGKVAYELRLRSFLGPDSVRAAGAAAEASRENKLYPFADLFYRRQQEENTGYVTDAFIREIASAVGVNPDKAVKAANDGSSQALVAQAESQAAALGSRGTPDFYLRLKGGRLVPVQPQELTPASFTKALDQALQSGA
jgi:protein-disulfide isomerase